MSELGDAAKVELWRQVVDAGIPRFAPAAEDDSRRFSTDDWQVVCIPAGRAHEVHVFKAAREVED